ncbi:MAG: DUF1553 domain-containing protein [Planctomycetes bacterium]|nr:DUF1553 domain-containing protein [Planctomycetota bacterium]
MLCRSIIACLLLGLAGLETANSAEAPDPTQRRITDSSSGAIRFSRDVVPALTRAGCNAGVCHGSFQGRGGLQLSLLGYDPAFDHEVLTKASRGRRINIAAPEHSLLLLKPTGVVPHGGGRRIAPDSEVARLIDQWISSGAPAPKPGDLQGLRIHVEPTELTLPATSSTAALQVVATFGDGEVRNVTTWAQFDVRDQTIAEVSRAGIVTAQRSGKTSVAVKYQGQVASVSVSVPYGPATDFAFPPRTALDVIVAAEWRKLGVVPAPLADDATYLRRVHLDLIGTLPTPAEVRAFLEDPSADKRSRRVDELLGRPEYVDYWSLKWGDLLRAHRRYLGEKGLASFNGWIRQSVRENKPLDVMTRELLTAKGNLFTNGPVAYFFIDEKVEDLAETTSQVFLGIRLQCTKCHHHPNEVWSQQDYYGLAAFFSRLEMKDSGTQGARFGGPKSIRPSLVDNPNRKPQMAVTAKVLSQATDPAALKSVPPTGDAVDPRLQLAEWITSPDNPYFARNFANRYWAALLGVGLVEPVDDQRATNPATMPTLLDALAADFVAHQFDPKHLLRTICNSRVYQLAPELQSERDADGILATHRVPRRLSAEVLLDAINQVTGTTETFVGQPPGTRAIALPDPTIASLFLTTFGKPARNSPCDCSRSASPDLSQALHLANSTALHTKLTAADGRLTSLLKAGRSDDEIADELYLAAFARFPTADERQAVHEITAEGNREEAWQDILWALLNCPEFAFGH